ncbi:hypothetical protein KVM94_06410 [Helicobacter pylori]|nr:hypothetical protein KVM94_06410 [Helicobacter pylori]
MDSSVFLDALDIGYSFNAKLLWILADVGDEIDLISLYDGFIKYTQTTISYLVKATQGCIKTLTEPHSTQSKTESIFLYLLIQMLLNLTLKAYPIKPAHENF